MMFAPSLKSVPDDGPTNVTLQRHTTATRLHPLNGKRKWTKKQRDALQMFISGVGGSGGVPGHPGCEFSRLCILDSGQRTLDLRRLGV